jgi:hypothetical protein
MINKKKALITFLIIVVILILGIDRCQRSRDLDNLTLEMNKVRMENEKFEYTINEQGEQIALQAQMIVSKNEAIKLGMKKIKGLTNYKNQVVIKTQTKYDTIFAAYDIDTTQKSQGEVKFSYSEPWISFDGKLLDSGVAITDLTIKNEYVITIADKKLGFFKKPEPVVSLINKNPYTQTQGMTNITIKQNQPLYKRPWVWVTFGITSGIIISRL